MHWNLMEEILGLAFQIADDALDYYSTKKIFGKRNR